MRGSSRRLAAAVALLCCLPLAAPVDAVRTGPTHPCAGTVTEPAAGTTVISVQGFEFGEDGGKRSAKLVGMGPEGTVQWVHHNGEELDVLWSYDVDPLPDGNVFVTAELESHDTLVYEFDPRTQEVVWRERFDIADTHDADLIDGGEEILVANMRNYNASSGENDDRLFVYDRSADEIEWEWRFDDHYDPAALEENYTDDWTHVNDVDKIGEGLYLASPRNFDQVIVVNRTTNEIEMKLGADGRTNVLKQQHNPDYLESVNGTPTILVADSENDRIVEYANPDGDLTDGTGWQRTWTLRGNLAWPRDADRLPNGNTLVTDSANDRVIEVAPDGEVVWEAYAPWLVYDAARLEAGEHGGPAMADRDAGGVVEVTGDADVHGNRSALRACHHRLKNVTGWAEGREPTTSGADTTEGAMADETDGGSSDGRDAGDDGQETGTDGQETDVDDSGASIPGFGAAVALVGLLVALGSAGTQSR